LAGTCKKHPADTAGPSRASPPAAAAEPVLQNFQKNPGTLSSPDSLSQTHPSSLQQTPNTGKPLRHQRCKKLAFDFLPIQTYKFSEQQHCRTVCSKLDAGSVLQRRDHTADVTSQGNPGRKNHEENSAVGDFVRHSIRLSHS
jgi:hypothetical protein